MSERGNTALFKHIMGTHWSLTPYVLCDLRCVYCCVGAQGASTPVMDTGAAVGETRRWLAQTADPRHVVIGAFSDGYPSVEAAIGLTRAVMRELVAVGQYFSVVTKSTSVLRDLDLLVAAGDRASVAVSICSTDESALRRLEPGAPSGEERLAVVAKLHEAGVTVRLNVLPWIPGITDIDALTRRVPAGVGLTVGPLTFAGGKVSRRLLGDRVIYGDVVRGYMQEYERLGHLANSSWLQPASSPSQSWERNGRCAPRLSKRRSHAAHFDASTR